MMFFALRGLLGDDAVFGVLCEGQKMAHEREKIENTIATVENTHTHTHTHTHVPHENN